MLRMTAVEVRCMQMGKGPTCATVFLEDPRDGSRNRPNTTCNPNYSLMSTGRFRMLCRIFGWCCRSGIRRDR